MRIADKLRSTASEVFDGLQREITGIRHLITELRPAALDDLGLDAALQALARRAEGVYGLQVETDVDIGADHEQGRLDPELETTVYRIMQEGLNNVARHAQARRAVMSIVERDAILVATVTDDGKGISDSSSSREGRENGHAEEAGTGVRMGGYGLPGMRERAELVGGDLELRSVAWAGNDANAQRAARRATRGGSTSRGRRRALSAVGEAPAAPPRR